MKFFKGLAMLLTAAFAALGYSAVVLSFIAMIDMVVKDEMIPGDLAFFSVATGTALLLAIVQTRGLFKMGDEN